MKSVILVAGMSTRMRQLTNDKPKCLIPVGGATILEHQLMALELAEVDSITVVTGYMNHRVDAFIDTIDTKANIKTIFNKDYETTDNAYSLALALEPTDESVIFLDGDILFDPILLSILTHNKNCLLVNNMHQATDEDCKVEVSNGFAIGIGKEKDSEIIYTSMARLDGDILHDFRRELGKNTEWYSGPLDRILWRNPESVRVKSIGRGWVVDIDTEQDLREAWGYISM